MTTLITLDNPIFWTPPGAHSAHPSVMKFSRSSGHQLPSAVAAASLRHASTGAYEGRRRPSASQPWTTNNVVLISSDEESDVNDDDDQHDSNADEPHPDDSLPSIATIAASIASERLRVTTDPQESETAATTGNTRPCGASALDQVGRPVATRTSSPTSSLSNPVDTLPVAAPSLQTEPPIFEDHNDLHDQVANTSYQSRPVSASDSVSSVPKVNLSTTPPNRHGLIRGSDVEGQPSAPASHHHDGLGHGEVDESAPAQRTTTEPGNSRRSQRSSSNDGELHLPPANNRGIPSAPSNSHQNDRACVEESRHVSKDPRASRSQNTNGTRRRRLQMSQTVGSRDSHRRAAAKRDYVEDRTDYSDDEDVPARKRPKAVARARKRHDQVVNVRPPPRAQPRRSRKHKSNGDIVTSPNSEAASLASYEEWPVSDAVLKCVQDNGTSTFQLQFTWATSCMAHASSKVDGRGLASPGERTEVSVGGNLEEPIQRDYTDGNADVFQVECLLARWGKHTFFLRWSDGTTGWEPKRNILDKQMLDEFEARYQGFDEGVDVLDSRSKAGKRQYLLHWHDRPLREDSWVDEKLMSPIRVERISACGLGGIH